jgi:membrane protease YdiL (CAAX protease family)
MTLLRQIFISPPDLRLRAGWRIAAQTLFMGLIFGCVLSPFALSLSWLTSGTGLLIAQIAEFIGITLSVFLARRILDKRSIGSMGLRMERRALADLLAGIMIAFIMVGTIYLIEFSMGWVTFYGYAWEFDSLQKTFSQTFITLLTFLLVGWNEELLSRGYHLQNITDGMNIYWGVAISSFIFGILHLANFNATWQGAVGVILAGIFLAVSFLWSGQLWLPIGLHIGWNFCEGVIFGYPVSGLNTYRLVRTSINGPVFWTGGAFGPEGGVIIIPALLLGLLIVYQYTRNPRKSDNRMIISDNNI